MKKIFSFLAAILVAGSMWGAEPVTVKSTFSKKTVPANNQVTDVEGVITWDISTTVGAGEPTAVGGSYSSTEAIKFGGSKSVYFSKIEFSTDYFEDYNVTSVKLYVLNNGKKTGTFTAKQGSITIGSESKEFGTAWTLLTANKTEGEGGTLTVTYEVDQASYWSYIEVTYEVPELDPTACVTPKFDPVAGTYNAAQSVALTCDTEGATIYYTTNGDAPTTESAQYTAAISVDKSMTIKAIAVKDGLNNSTVAEAAYVLQPKTPSIEGDAIFSEEATVTLACETEGTQIHYTLNGDDPDAESTLYEAPFKVNATTTVKAIAIKSNWTNSEIASKKFTKETLMTVAEAIAEIDKDKTKTTENVTVVGYVVSDVTRTSNSAGAITYALKDIDENGFLTGSSLTVYSGKKLGNANFSKGEGVSAGDKVYVRGNIFYYTKGSLYEIASGNYITLHDTAHFVETRIYGTAKKTEYEKGEDFDHDGLNTKDVYTTGYAEPLSDSNTDDGISWVANPAKVEADGTVQVKVSYDYNSKAYESPWFNVNVTVKTHAVTFGTLTNGSIKLSGEKIASGNEFVKGVELIVAPDEGFKIKSVKVIETGSDPENDVTSSVYSAGKITVPAYAITVTAEFEKDGATAVDNTEVSEKAVKMIVNGQIVIEKNGVRYNAMGQIVR